MSPTSYQTAPPRDGFKDYSTRRRCRSKSVNQRLFIASEHISDACFLYSEDDENSTFVQRLCNSYPRRLGARRGLYPTGPPSL